VNAEWVESQLVEFLQLTELYRPASAPGVINLTSYLSNRGREADIVASAQVVEQILDRLTPRWRVDVPDGDNKRVNKWSQHIEAVRRARVVLVRQAEIDEQLGDNAPLIRASQLHPWVWDGARSLWQSGHFRQAVHAAAVKLNAETQNRLGRTDITEQDLFVQAFSLDAPTPGKPRLRVMADDGSKTFQSIHRGVQCYAQGCYAAIRNPISHVEGDLDEAEALEQLAALSILARWVDTAAIKTA
jgi:hypothetical protein